VTRVHPLSQRRRPAPSAFDPSALSVREVIAYLDGVDEAERERVIAIEAAGKNRKSITGG